MPTTTYEWGTIGAVAELVGCSRRTLERALKRDGEVDGHTIEQRAAAETDYARPDITRRSSRVVRAVAPDGEPLLIEVELHEEESSPVPPDTLDDENQDGPTDELDAELEKFVGRRVLLTGDHPYAQRTGEIVRVESFLGSPALVVRLDSGHECGVTNPAHIQFLDAPPSGGTIIHVDVWDDHDESDEAEPIGDRIDGAVAAAYGGTGSPESTLNWLERVRRGEVKEEKLSGGNSKPILVPASLRARTKAAVEAEKLRQFLDERERNYIPKHDVADALVTVGTLVRNRMQAVPSRLADEVAIAEDTNEIRKILARSIDDILRELGDAVEGELAELVGDTQPDMEEA